MALSYEKDQTLVGILAAIFVLLSLLFNLQLGQIYLGMLFVIYIFVDDNPAMQGYSLFSNSTGKNKWIEVIFYGAIGYAIFVLAVQFVISPIFHIQNSQLAIFQWVQSLVLENSFATKLITMGFLVPIAESLLTGIGTVLISKWAGVNMLTPSFTWIVPMVIIGGLAVFYHIQAKGITNGQDLSISFMFFALNAGMVLWKRRFADGVFMHIINNVRSIIAV